MKPIIDHTAMLQTAIEEARAGLVEGGIPIGAALYSADGALLGRGNSFFRSLQIWQILLK